MNREYPMWTHVKEVSENKNHNNYDFIVIGDSRVKAGFIPKQFDSTLINSYNLSVGGGTPIEGYYTLKRYLNNHKSPKYLLLSYAPQHLMEAETYWLRTVKLHYLDLADYLEIKKTAHDINDTDALKSGSLIHTLFNPFFNLPEFKNGILEKRWETNHKILEALYTTKGQYYFGKARQGEKFNVESKLQQFNYSPLIKYYLIKLIKLAEKYNIKTYWYTMPFNKSSYQMLNKSYEEQYNNYLNTLSKKYNIIVLNKLDFLDNSNFGDNSHLFSGAKNVTNDIRQKFQSTLK